MDNLVPRMYKQYGMMVNSNRAFPLDLDGLKPVERRIMLAAYNIARDKFVKSARVDGECMGKYHPHSSSYGTIVQLVHQGFLDGQGGFGNNYGVEDSPAAAMRYTECKLAKSTNEFAFRLIDYVPWAVSELKDPDITEPEFLPTRYPLCLMGTEYTMGIGFGYKCLIPCYKVEDLKRRLLSLLKKEKTNPIIKPITNCQILSNDAELDSLLKTGKASITVKGIYKVDKLKQRVIVKSWPTGKKFESILSNFSNELDNQDIGFRDESSDMNGGTHIVFEVIKQRNREVILNRFIQKLDEVLVGSIPFETIVVGYKSKNVRLMSIDEMLLSTYEMYKDCNFKMLNSESARLQKIINENNIIRKIKPALAKHMNMDLDRVIAMVSSTTKVEEEVVKNILQKYRITKLFTVNTDITEVQENIKVIEENLKTLDKFVLSQY